MSAPLHQSREPMDRVRAALDELEEAQGHILRAAEALSSIVGFSSEHAKTLEQFDRIRTHWYKIREASQRKEGKLKLDEMALRSCDDRDAQAKLKGTAPNGTECERHGMRLCPVCVGFPR